MAISRSDETDAWLAPLPGLLAGIPQSVRSAAPPPGPPAPPPTPAGARGRPARRQLTVAAAAFLAAGAAGGLWASSGFAGHSPATLTFAGADQATHVSATATLTATTWGSSIQLRLSGRLQNVECRLVVRSLDGATEVGGAWNAWATGTVSVPASASWLPSDIASLQVTTSAKTLVTMSAS